MTKPKKFEAGSSQWLMMRAAEKRPEPYVTTDFLIFNDAVVTFEITVKIIKETFATNESQPTKEIKAAIKRDCKGSVSYPFEPLACDKTREPPCHLEPSKDCEKCELNKTNEMKP